MIRAQEHFLPQTYSISEFLTASGKAYVIPAYQRPYAWGDKQTDKLLDGVINGLSNLARSRVGVTNFTFIGTVITARTNNNARDLHIGTPAVSTDIVVDGQQRISTIVLLSLALSLFLRRTARELIQSSAASEQTKQSLLQKIDYIDGELYSLTSFTYVMRGGESRPKLIRAYQDTLDPELAKCRFGSNIAHIIAEYLRYVKSSNFETDFPLTNPAENVGTNIERKRFSRFRKQLELYVKDSSDASIFAAIPGIAELTRNSDAIDELLNQSYAPQFYEDIQENLGCADVFRIICLCSYLLHRVAITVVEGRTEYFAFEVFESLNTTGEPLNAWETFKPSIVRNIASNAYVGSPEKELIDKIQGAIDRSSNEIKDKKSFVENSVILVALSQSGEKLGKELASQREQLSQIYSQIRDNPEHIIEFLRLFQSVVYFLEVSDSKSHSRRSSDALNFLNSMRQQDPIASLCLQFLVDIKHSLAFGPVIAYYRRYLFEVSVESRAHYLRDVAESLRAVTAFSLMWRAARGETAGIDKIYRELMIGDDHHFPGFCKRIVPEIPSVAQLKIELKRRLFAESVRVDGPICDFEGWITRASVKATYKQKKLAKFFLLAAYHDSEPDLDSPGLLRAHKENIWSCLDIDRYRGDDFFTIEHIEAQQSARNNVEYQRDPDLVHRLGNLVLIPPELNSLLSNRPWSEKRVIFQCVNANPADMRALLLGAGFGQIGERTIQSLLAYRAQPQLASLCGVTSESWSKGIIERRSDNLLRLAGNRLMTWL